LRAAARDAKLCGIRRGRRRGAGGERQRERERERERGGGVSNTWHRVTEAATRIFNEQLTHLSVRTATALIFSDIFILLPKAEYEKPHEYAPSETFHVRETYDINETNRTSCFARSSERDSDKCLARLRPFQRS